MHAPTKPISIKLDERDKERLRKLGEARKRTPHWLAREAIGQYLDREERLEQFRQETAARWEDFCRTGKSVPHTAVVEWLDSWGTDSGREAPE
ncbi:MAG: CopG family ribbon-helix-helix protein [Desulfobulbaceae bacterium]